MNSVSKFSIEPCAERFSGESLSFTSATSNVLCEMEEGMMVVVVAPVVVVGVAGKGEPGRATRQMGSEMGQEGRLVGAGEGVLWTGREGAEVRQRMDLLGSLWVMVGEEFCTGVEAWGVLLVVLCGERKGGGGGGGGGEEGRGEGRGEGGEERYEFNMPRGHNKREERETV